MHTPSDGSPRRAHDLAELVAFHAGHEDEFVQPRLRRIAPALADVVAADHPALDAAAVAAATLVERAADGPPARRRASLHRGYLALASFTSDYLAHQAFEELEVQPALGAVMP